MQSGEDQNQGERVDLRSELDGFEKRLEELKVQYEQYFMGLVPIAPDPLHNDLKRRLRSLRKAPFKSSQITYKLKMLEGRYNTYNTYWQRVIREKDAGRYYKDVFKAQVRAERFMEEEAAQTDQGKASKSMENLFKSYNEQLEKTTGQRHNIKFEDFKKSLVKRAKDLKERTGAKKLTFSIVVKNGKVTVQAKAKK